MNSLYIVTATDTDTKENLQYEESTKEKAMIIYNMLKDDPTIENLLLLEYNLIEQRYHIVII